MPSNLLKTIFLQNEVDFRNIELVSSYLPKQSQIDFSILSNGNEIFIAMNPATHKFDLSQLNKVTGKQLSHIENISSSTLLNAEPQNFKKGVLVFIDEALEYYQKGTWIE